MVETRQDDESQRLIHDTQHTPRTTLSIMARIYNEEGIKGFFVGFWISLAVYIPHSAIYFIMYEMMKRFCVSWGLGSTTTTLEFYGYILSSAVAGAVAAACSNIVDVVKTILQSTYADPDKTSDSDSDSINSDTHRRSSLAIAAELYRLGGAMAFFSGMLARVLYFIPNIIISFTVYEMIKKEWKLE